LGLASNEARVLASAWEKLNSVKGAPGHSEVCLKATYGFGSHRHLENLKHEVTQARRACLLHGH